MTDKQWPNCKCTFAQHMVGDGCGICNPEFYKDMKDDEMTPIEKVKAALEYTAQFLDRMPVDNPRTYEAKQFAVELKEALRELDGMVIITLDEYNKLVQNS